MLGVTDLVGQEAPPLQESSNRRATPFEPEMSLQSAPAQSCWAVDVVAEEHDHAPGTNVSPVHLGDVVPDVPTSLEIATPLDIAVDHGDTPLVLPRVQVATEGSGCMVGLLAKGR